MAASTVATKCVALLSGGLDSMLAIRIMQQQGVEVEAVNFKTLFTCCQDLAGQAARDLGVRLTVIAEEDDYLDLIRRPRFGYGKGANPCVDCRIYMFQAAAVFMQAQGADFIVSGEVVGQRPMSQKRRDLNTISHHAGLEDLLLRPLSAKRLAPTKPERAGWVDREQLYAFTGRSRKGLIRLAKRFGIDKIPAPSTGCALTEPMFSRKVHDLVQIEPTAARWDFELLKHGRHFRFDRRTKVVVGRHEAENALLEHLHSLPDATSTALITPNNFAGPAALVVGPSTDDSRQFAAGLVRRYAKLDGQDPPIVRVEARDGGFEMEAVISDDAHAAKTLASA